MTKKWWHHFRTVIMLDLVTWRIQHGGSNVNCKWDVAKAPKQVAMGTARTFRKIRLTGAGCRGNIKIFKQLHVFNFVVIVIVIVIVIINVIVIVIVIVIVTVVALALAIVIIKSLSLLLLLSSSSSLLLSLSLSSSSSSSLSLSLNLPLALPLSLSLSLNRYLYRYCYQYCYCYYNYFHLNSDIDECASNPCLYGGTCTDLVNGFTCGCVPGFRGTRCQTG